MIDVIKAHNYYSEHQQKNHHTPRVMQSLGLADEDIKLFCLHDNVVSYVSENQAPEIIIINIRRINIEASTTRETLKQYELRALGKQLR